MTERRRLFLTLTALGVLIGAIAIAVSGLGDFDLELEDTSGGLTVRPTVSVLRRKPATARPFLRAFGEVTAEFDVTMAAEVEGVIVSISRATYSGGRLHKGDVILTMDDTRYRRALAEAQENETEARRRLIEEQLRAQLAADEWERSEEEGQPPPYLLREPHIAAARLTLESAEVAVQEARRNLERAVVRAPFNAVVIERLRSPGSYVQPGTELVRLYSSDRIEVRLPLTHRQWSLLPGEDVLKQRWDVELWSTDGSRRWIGRVLRIEKHLQSETRQRSLVVAVDDPLDQVPPLFPGTFVRAAIPGVELENMLEVPTSALDGRSEIWYVDKTDALARVPVTPVVADEGNILVPTVEGYEELRVLLHPMESYMPGLVVRVEEANE